jgi:hypothetical protein
VIGTAIPQVQTIQGLVAAAFLLQFSYSWPPLMQLAFDIQADASRIDGVYEAGRGVRRHDSWRDPNRWRRGLFTGRMWFKGVNLMFFLAALATCALGIYGSVRPHLDCIVVPPSRAPSRGGAAGELQVHEKPVGWRERSDSYPRDDFLDPRCVWE